MLSINQEPIMTSLANTVLAHTGQVLAVFVALLIKQGWGFNQDPPDETPPSVTPTPHGTLCGQMSPPHGSARAPNGQNNCTTQGSAPVDDDTSLVAVGYDEWKFRVIIACTILATLEFVLIMVIIMCWRQIRWTLRKLTCPCTECCRRYRRGNTTDSQADEDEGEEEVEEGLMELSVREEYFLGSDVNNPSSRYTVLGLSGPSDRSVPGPSGLSSAYPSTRYTMLAVGRPSVSDNVVAGPSGLSVKSWPECRVSAHSYSSEESLSDSDWTVQTYQPPRVPPVTKAKGIRHKSTARAKHSEETQKDVKFQHDTSRQSDTNTNPGHDTRHKLEAADKCHATNENGCQSDWCARQESTSCDKVNTDDSNKCNADANNDRRNADTEDRLERER